MMNQVRVVVLGGFLGAGKTTAALAAIAAFRKRGISAVYIANDQGQGLVDTLFSSSLGAVAGEVTGGCFCCRFNELAEGIHKLATENRADVVIAEAVGSCTDLIATVIRPLVRDYGSRYILAPYTVLVDAQRFEDMQRIRGTNIEYLFSKQLEEAQTIGVSKSDLRSSSELAELTAQLNLLAPSADVRIFSSRTGVGLDALVDGWLTTDTDSLDQMSPELDYDAYADAEARMGWVNIAARVAIRQGLTRQRDWMDAFFGSMRTQLQGERLTVGHIKVHLHDGTGDTKASMVNTNDSIQYDIENGACGSIFDALINARVEADPDLLVRMINGAIREADTGVVASTILNNTTAFRPAYPRPVHRL
jgi:G3E family GTPase